MLKYMCAILDVTKLSYCKELDTEMKISEDCLVIV